MLCGLVFVLGDKVRTLVWLGNVIRKNVNPVPPTFDSNDVLTPGLFDCLKGFYGLSGFFSKPYQFLLFLRSALFAFLTYYSIILTLGKFCLLQQKNGGADSAINVRLYLKLY